MPVALAAAVQEQARSRQTEAAARALLPEAETLEADAVRLESELAASKD